MDCNGNPIVVCREVDSRLREKVVLRLADVHVAFIHQLPQRSRPTGKWLCIFQSEISSPSAARILRCGWTSVQVLLPSTSLPRACGWKQHKGTRHLVYDSLKQGLLCSFGILMVDTPNSSSSNGLWLHSWWHCR